MWDLLFDAVTDWMLHFGPRWMRVGCVFLLIAAVAGLLGLALYFWILK